MSSIFSIGQMNQAADAFEKAGFTPEDITKLGQFKNLKGIKDVLFGIAEISYPEHLINCDVDPYLPDGWSVEEHKPGGGQFSFNPTNIELYLSKKQVQDSIVGDDLWKELNGKKVLNACVLDYLLVHPEIIPEEWKGKYIFFFGTVYRNSDDFLYVRYLDWDGSEWYWCCYWLGGDFYSRFPVALASLT